MLSKIKQRLLQAQVELEDKIKVCVTLQRKLEETRGSIASIPERIEREFSIDIDSSSLEKNRHLDKVSKEIETALLKKQQLLKSCQQNMDLLTTAQDDVTKEIQLLQQHLRMQLESDRKSFRASHQERLQKYLQDRLAEYRERTERALQPEFQRLQHNHELELMQLQQWSERELKRLRDELSDTFDLQLQQEQKLLQEAHSTFETHAHEQFEQDKLMYENLHHSKIEKLRLDLRRQLDVHRENCMQEIESYHKQSQDQMLKSQRDIQIRIQAIKSSQEEELQEIRKSTETKVKQLQANHNNELKLLEDTLRKNVIPNDSIDPSVLLELMNERERRIQLEIKQFQIQTVQLEKMWKRDNDSQLQDIESFSSTEEKQLQDQLLTIQKQIQHYLSSQQHKSQVELPELQQKLQSLVEEDSCVKQKLNILDRELSDREKSQEEIQKMQHRRQQDEQDILVADLQTLKKQFETTNTTLLDRRQQLEDELKIIVKEADRDLERVDRFVKSQVREIDASINLIKEKCSEEEIRCESLEKLILKYQQ